MKLLPGGILWKGIVVSRAIYGTRIEASMIQAVVSTS